MLFIFRHLNLGFPALTLTMFRRHSDNIPQDLHVELDEEIITAPQPIFGDTRFHARGLKWTFFVDFASRFCYDKPLTRLFTFSTYAARSLRMVCTPPSAGLTLNITHCLHRVRISSGYSRDILADRQADMPTSNTILIVNVRYELEKTQL